MSAGAPSEARYRVDERLGICGDYTTPATRAMADAERTRWSGEPLTVTRLSPAALGKRPQIGTSERVSWDWLWLWARSPQVLARKADGGAVVFAALTDGVRLSASVERVTAVVIDYDGEGGESCQPSRGHRLLASWGHVMHTTHSHTTQSPRWRAYLRLSRPTTPQEHAVVWAHVADRIPLRIDHATRDPARLWYVPGLRSACATCAPHVALLCDAPPIDVDAALAERETYVAATPAVELQPVVHADRYARAALERERAAVASASPGGRHGALVSAAYSLSRLPTLDQALVERELVSAFVGVAGEARRREGEACVRDAYRHRRGGA